MRGPAPGDPDGLPHISVAPREPDLLWVPTARQSVPVKTTQLWSEPFPWNEEEIDSENLETEYEGSVWKAFRVSTMPGAGD